MANVTTIYDGGNTVQVVAGSPPADQTALVAQLQIDKAALQSKLDQLKTLAQARKTADAASVDGQAELDVIG